MEWKPIVGYENYEISEYGDIRNLNTGKIRKKHNFIWYSAGGRLIPPALRLINHKSLYIKD